MFETALAIHLGGAVVSLAAAVSLILVTLGGNRVSVRRHLGFLATLMVLNGTSGAVLSILSGTPAIATCNNLAVYVAAFAGVASWSAWRIGLVSTDRISFARPVIAGSILPFVPALIATLTGF